jgi:integrase
MGRKRDKNNAKLPPYVYLAKGRYIFRQYINGKLGKEKRLCNGDATLSEVWAAFEAITGREQNTMRWLFSEFLGSNQFRQMASKTQKEMDRQSLAISKRRLNDGREFGDLLLTEISPGLIRKYLDNRGKEAPVAANREVALMSIAFSWGRERDLCKDNPCYGVRRNKEMARTRYITDEEYDLVFNLAVKISPPYLPIAMEIAFLCRARRKEILELTHNDVLEEGLYIQRVKKSNSHIIGWTTRLRKAVNSAISLSAHSKNDHLVLNQKGNKITARTFSTAWQRLMAKAQEIGLEERFTFHDLKAKGVSDFDGDKKLASGHKSDAMVDVYDRKPKNVKATK